MNKYNKRETVFGVLKVPETRTVSIVEAMDSLESFLEDGHRDSPSVLIITKSTTNTTKKSPAREYIIVEQANGKPVLGLPNSWQGYSVVHRKTDHKRKKS